MHIVRHFADMLQHFRTDMEICIQIGNLGSFNNNIVISQSLRTSLKIKRTQIWGHMTRRIKGYQWLCRLLQILWKSLILRHSERKKSPASIAQALVREKQGWELVQADQKINGLPNENRKKNDIVRDECRYLENSCFNYWMGLLKYLLKSWT